MSAIRSVETIPAGFDEIPADALKTLAGTSPIRFKEIDATRDAVESLACRCPEGATIERNGKFYVNRTTAKSFASRVN